MRFTEQTKQAFALDDPAPYRDWIGQFAALFEALDDRGWADLRRWANLFQATPGPVRVGTDLIRELDNIAREAGLLSDDARDAKMSATATTLDTPKLSELARAAEGVAAPASFVARLSPWRWSKRSKVDGFVVRCGLDRRKTSPRRIEAALKLEMAIRPLRKRLAAVHAVLLDGGTLALDSLSPAAFRAVVDETRQAIGAVYTLVCALERYPEVASAAAVMGIATREAFAALLDGAKQSFARHHARAESRAALNGLKAWFNDEWLAARQASINADAANGSAIAELRRGLPMLVAYQQFRLRSSGLGEEELEVLRRLRASEAALSNIPAAELEAETRRLISREARLEWKARMEARDPILLLEADELQAKVVALERTNAEMRQFNRQMVVEDIDPRLLKSRREWDSIMPYRRQHPRRRQGHQSARRCSSQMTADAVVARPHPTLRDTADPRLACQPLRLSAQAGALVRVITGR